MKNEKKNPHLASYSECTGCGACAASCHHNAISMQYDKNGHLMPFVSSVKCVGCGVCTYKCPVQNHSTTFHSVKEIKTYSAWSKNDELCLSATSGGVFAQLALDALKNNENAIVFGAELSDHNTCKHVGITKISELPRILGTKYLQSDVSDAYGECKKSLQEGQNVCFCGTPCQIAGLYSFLGKINKDKLLTIELICHGVPSKITSDISCQYYGAHHIVSFRNKNSGWHKGFDCTYADRDGNIIEKGAGEFFYRNFGGTDRPSCYHCLYARIERCADITLGDQWGLKDKYPDRASLGANLVICNDSKGDDALTQSDMICFNSESCRSLNAPTLFMPIAVSACSLSKHLFFIKKFPNCLKFAIISIDWRQGWYLIPLAIWRKIIVKHYQQNLKDKIKFTRKQNNWK